MRNGKKRLIAALLAMVLVLGTTASILIAATEDHQDPSIVLLEAMLYGDRNWVIDTIVEDDRSGNPYASAYPSTKKSLMDTALSQIENPDDPNYRKSYSIMVEYLTKFLFEATWDDDITAGMLDLVDEILELFGDGENALGDFLDDLKKTTEEEKFEAIIQSVFTDTYTSSWGEKVNEQEVALRQLSEIATSLENYEKLANYWSALYGVANDDDSETIIDYQKNVIHPLISSGKQYLGAFSEMSEGEQAAASVAITGASALAMWNWSASHSTTYSGVTPLTTDLLDMVAGKEAVSLLNTMGDTFSFASGAINQFTFLNAMCQQRDTFHDTLLRISAQATNDGHIRMSGVLEDYADQMDDVLNENELYYNLFVDQLAKTSTIKKNLKISKALDAAMSDAWMDAYSSCDLKAATLVFSVGMFAVDQATGIKNTCIKISELKYLREMINETKKVYYSDLEAYTGDPSGENAGKVLDDLIFLQRLRLRGENIAYKITKGQLNSGIGKLVSGYTWQDWLGQEDTTEAEAWTKHYQHSIDCLIGASIDPISYVPFEISSGENLVIYYDEEAGSYRGGYSDGSVLYEMQYRVMSGIDLNGGTLSLMDISVPFVNVTNGGTLSIDASTAQIGELTQTGSMTLNVNHADLEFQTCLDLRDAVVNLNGYTISSPDMTFTSSVAFSDGQVETEALHLNAVTVSGDTIRCTGNVDATGSCTLENLTLAGTQAQTISGNLSVDDLVLNNTKEAKIKSDGTITVTGTLQDADNIVTNGIVLSGTAAIVGNEVASDLTLHGTSIPKAVSYKRSVTVKNGATLHGGNVRGSMILTSGTFTNTGSELILKNGIISTNAAIVADAPVVGYENSYFSNTVFSGTAAMDLHGEAAFASGNSAGSGSVINLYGNCASGSDKDSNQLATLNLCGTAGQTIQYTGTVENLNISNTSLFGVEMTGNTYVTGNLTAADQRISLGNNIILTGESTALLENVSGNLQIQDWSGTGISGLNGTLYAYGTNVIRNDMALSGGIRQPGGSVTLEGATITCRESLECAGTWSIDEDSALVTAGDASLSGTIMNDGLLGAKTLILAATLEGSGTLEVTGDLTSTVENAVEKLLISGTSGQTISGSKLTAAELAAENTSYPGITFEDEVWVTERLTAQNQRIRSGENLILTGDAAAELENVSGSLRIKDWNGTDISELTGTLYASGQNVISTDMDLRGGIRQTDGSVTIRGAAVTCQESLECAGSWNIGEGGALITSGDGMMQGAIVNDGTLKAADLTLNGSLSGSGSLEVTGDLTSGTANTFGALLLSGTQPQTVSGANMTVTDLTVRNTAARGVTFDTQVYVTGAYTGSGRIRGILPIQLTDGSVFDRDATVAALSPAGDLFIGENVTLTVDGNLTVSGLLHLADGAKLIVRGSLVGTGAAIETAADSHVEVRRNLRLDSASVTLGGSLTVWQDTILTGGTVTGDGTLVLKGDLTSSAAVSGLNRLVLAGQVPQTISGSDIHVAYASAENLTYGGVELQLVVYYKEGISISDGCNISEDQFKEE